MQAEKDSNLSRSTSNVFFCTLSVLMMPFDLPFYLLVQAWWVAQHVFQIWPSKRCICAPRPSHQKSAGLRLYTISFACVCRWENDTPMTLMRYLVLSDKMSRARNLVISFCRTLTVIGCPFILPFCPLVQDWWVAQHVCEIWPSKNHRSVQHNHLPILPIASKMAIGQAEQDPNLPCSASNVLERVHLCLTVAAQVEVPAGKVNLRGILSRSAGNVLETMLHPATVTGNFLTCPCQDSNQGSGDRQPAVSGKSVISSHHDNAP